MIKIIFLLFLAPASILCFAQPLPVPRNIAKAYEKGTRSADGRPGKNYWQNSANYKLNINFDPATRILRGSVDIHYFNNSPDTLKQVWFKLYANLYQKGAPRSSSVQPEDVTDGMIIDSLWLNGRLMDKAQISISATNMILNRQQVLPKHTADFRIRYHYTLNKTSHIRTGEVAPNAHFVAYFFPRVAVYDDIDGWNRHPYNGKQEFYNDFCNFEANIVVPQKFVVWATGDLTNAASVLAPAIHRRLLNAGSTDSITTIIDSTDLDSAITAPGLFNAWMFKAENVTDFVFASSDHYVWKSTSVVVDAQTKRRTRVDAVFNPTHGDYFEVVHDARKTVESMSFRFPKWPFPYSHITVFDGLDQMEYPMMVNDNPVEDRAESIELTDHEIFHTMFPFFTGINETKYAWMDEGWATMGEWLITPMIDSSIVDEYGVAPYEMNAGIEEDVPIITLSTHLNGTAYFLNSYAKPAFAYLYARDMLGDSIFTKALHYYIQQWQGRHPLPYDFFNCMNSGSGKNLNWFWKRWFFDTGVPDLGISSVTAKLKSYNIVITSRGTLPVPIDLTITFADKTITRIHRSVAVWEKGNRPVTVTVPVTQKIIKVELGATHNVDANKKDNVFMMK